MHLKFLTVKIYFLSFPITNQKHYKWASTIHSLSRGQSLHFKRIIIMQLLESVNLFPVQAVQSPSSTNAASVSGSHITLQLERGMPFFIKHFNANVSFFALNMVTLKQNQKKLICNKILSQKQLFSFVPTDGVVTLWSSFQIQKLAAWTKKCFYC